MTSEIHRQVCRILNDCTQLKTTLDRMTPNIEQTGAILGVLETLVMEARQAVENDWRLRRGEIIEIQPNMRILLAVIRGATERLTFNFSTDIALDAALGDLEAAVYNARQAISDEWSAARAQRTHKTPQAPTLDDLA